MIVCIESSSMKLVDTSKMRTWVILAILFLGACFDGLFVDIENDYCPMMEFYIGVKRIKNIPHCLQRVTYISYHSWARDKSLCPCNLQDLKSHDKVFEDNRRAMCHMSQSNWLFQMKFLEMNIVWCLIRNWLCSTIFSNPTLTDMILSIPAKTVRNAWCWDYDVLISKLFFYWTHNLVIGACLWFLSGIWPDS